MIWTYRTMIVPAAIRNQAVDLCASIAGEAGSNMFDAPLSFTGMLPATHYISSGLISQEFADMLGSADAIQSAALAANINIDRSTINMILLASHVDERPAGVVLSELDLKPIGA